VLAEMLEFAPGGVEERELGDGTVEYGVYGAPGELPSLPDLKAAAGGALVDVSTEEVADDWPERWRRFHRPLVIEGRLRVRPPWEPPGSEPLDLVIDPGRAFGTGAHPTTRLCLEVMLELDGEGSFVDLGCGSGVLAIAAARLGFDRVLALDIETAAVEATRENAARNGVELEVSRFDLRSEPLPRAGTVTANLLGPLLLEWARRARELPPRVIASGLLEAEAARIAGAFAERGLREEDRRALGGWIALLMQRAPEAG
jgi:ribosomal protein L11 methyltransferase